MSSDLKILQIVPYWPFEKSFGTQQRILQEARALSQIGRVSLAVLQFHDPDASVLEKTKREFFVEKAATLIPAPRNIWHKIRLFCGPSEVNRHARDVEEPARSEILRSRRDFDVTWVTQLRAAALFGDCQWRGCVLDVDDFPSTLERSKLKDSRGLARTIRGLLKVYALTRIEKRLARRFDVLAVCSEADRKWAPKGIPTHVVPNGFEMPALPPSRDPGRRSRIGFIGSLKYEPNVEAVLWFARNCWPLIKAEAPDCRLRLVGEGGPEIEGLAGAGIDRLGWVADTVAEMETWAASVVPVRSGAGTRVKIPEAFSRKCPVVSTRLGAYGYDVEHGRDLMLADTPEEFGACCVSLIRDPGAGAALAERAWARFVKQWSWDSIAPRIWAAAEECARMRTSLGV